MDEKKALVFLAEGFEEIEAITPVDLLRRAGVTVKTVAAGAGRTVTGARKITVIADWLMEEIPPGSEYDALILPGGMPGAERLARSPEIGALLRAQADAGRIVAAICAAPVQVLANMGLLRNRRFTCYPGMEGQVQGALWSEDRVVIDGNIITSRGAGTAAEWSLAIINTLLGAQAGEKIAKSVVYESRLGTPGSGQQPLEKRAARL